MATKKQPKSSGPLSFASPVKNTLIQRGKIEDDNSRKFLRNALGINKKKVEATRHTILSGPPGVGKTYGTMDECTANNINYIVIPPGTTDVIMATMLANEVYRLPKGKELVVILDDADDVVFRDYDTLNKWKIAMADTNYDIGQIPYYSHNVSMTTTINRYRDSGRDDLANALLAFPADSSVGVSIPMDRVRFVILCNLDLESPKSFRGKMKGAVEAVMDRFNYSRINLNWEYQWGWLAYVLSKSQPFEGHQLTNSQKKELLDWMHSNWSKLRSTSYRMVRKLAEAMINEPDSYEDLWATHLKGH